MGQQKAETPQKSRAQVESSVARRDFMYNTVTFLNFLIFFLAQISFCWGCVVTIAQDLPVEEGIDFFFSCSGFFKSLEQKERLNSK